MGSISVRKTETPVVQQPAPQGEWEPGRWLRAMMQWDPFKEMAPFRPFEEKWAFAPAFEVKETNEAFVFKADVPGVKESDLDVQVTGNRLTITGKREEEKRGEKDQYFTYERSYGSFTRSFTLPDGVDASKAVAELKEGVLLLSLPKTPETQPKKIAVNAPRS